MGRTNGLKGVAKTADAIERELVSLREKAEAIAHELGGRGRILVERKQELARGLHVALEVGKVAAPVVLVVVVVWKVRSARKEREFPARALRSLQGWRRLLADPEAMLRPRRPSRPGLLSALLTMVATAALRQVGERMVGAWMGPRRRVVHSTR